MRIASLRGIAIFVDTIDALKKSGFIFKRCVDLTLRPNVERPFNLMLWFVGILAIGVLSGKETAFPRSHVARYVIENVAHNLLVLLVAGNLKCVQIRQGKLRLV